MKSFKLMMFLIFIVTLLITSYIMLLHDMNQKYLPSTALMNTKMESYKDLTWLRSILKEHSDDVTGDTNALQLLLYSTFKNEYLITKGGEIFYYKLVSAGVFCENLDEVAVDNVVFKYVPLTTTGCRIYTFKVRILNSNVNANVIRFGFCPFTYNISIVEQLININGRKVGGISIQVPEDLGGQWYILFLVEKQSIINVSR